MTEISKRQALLDECQTIAENSLYTAQAHFGMADKAGYRAKLFFLIPASVAGVSGILTSFGLPGWIGAFASVAGLVTAVATFLGADRQAATHKSAANLFTCLRQEARALHETYQPSLSDEQLLAEVRRLGDRYNTLVQASEVTDNEVYEEARKRVQSGIFKPDFREGKK